MCTPFHSLHYTCCQYFVLSEVSVVFQMYRGGALQDRKLWIPQDIGRIKVDTDAGRVEFNPIQKKDEGIYTCFAINDVGEAETSANVRVLGT